MNSKIAHDGALMQNFKHIIKNYLVRNVALILQVLVLNLKINTVVVVFVFLNYHTNYSYIKAINKIPLTLGLISSCVVKIWTL